MNRVSLSFFLIGLHVLAVKETKISNKMIFRIYKDFPGILLSQYEINLLSYNLSLTGFNCLNPMHLSLSIVIFKGKNSS